MAKRFHVSGRPKGLVPTPKEGASKRQRNRERIAAANAAKSTKRRKTRRDYGVSADPNLSGRTPDRSENPKDETYYAAGASAAVRGVIAAKVRRQS